MFWQQHMTKKYGHLQKKKADSTVVKTEAVKKTATVGAANPGAETTSTEVKKIVQEAEPVKAYELSYADDIWSFNISSAGMGVKGITLKSFKGRDAQPKNVGYASGDNYSLKTSILGQDTPINFNFKKISERVFAGTAKVNGLEIEKRLTIDSKKYLIQLI